MKTRRFLPLLALLALLLAPFGHMAAAEAMAMPGGHVGMAASGHCDDMPAPEQGKPDRAMDCFIACAALATAEPAALVAAPASALAPLALPPTRFSGLSCGADPPPPRIS